MSSTSSLRALLVPILLAACVAQDREDVAALQPGATATHAGEVRGDSVLAAAVAGAPLYLPPAHSPADTATLAAATRRFQAAARRPDAVTGGATSLDQLFQRYARALDERDEETLRYLRITRDEFAWLYYPASEYHGSPHAVPPDTLWAYMEREGAADAARALDRFGGGEWRYLGYACARESRPRASMRLHGPCTLRLRAPDGALVDAPLVTEAVERDGRFKLTSLANFL